MLINSNGFREYDVRWLYKKDIDLEGIENLGKGLGSQIVSHTKKTNPRIIVGHDYRSYSEEIKSLMYIFLKFSIFFSLPFPNTNFLFKVISFNSFISFGA